MTRDLTDREEGLRAEGERLREDMHSLNGQRQRWSRSGSRHRRGSPGGRRGRGADAAGVRDDPRRGWS